MQHMSAEERRAFLLAQPRTATIATVRADGRPHIAPVWFDLDGDDILFTTWHTSVKAINVRRDPRIALCVDDERAPFAFVVINGTATISEDRAQLQHWATRIAKRYMGSDQAAAYGQRNGVAGELLVRVTIESVVAQTGVAD